MNKQVNNILRIWHKHFEDEQNQYSEFEPSDVEYFVGCMLYNTFNFSKALETMKSIDLSYDFLSFCGDYYEEFVDILGSFEFESEDDKLKFLQDFVEEARAKYNDDELYLLNRLKYHIDAMAQRYEKDEDVKKVEFVSPTKVANPLLR